MINHTTGIPLAATSRRDQMRCVIRLATAVCALTIGSWAIAAHTPATGADLAISDGTSNT